ncbi:bifunctional folylpolyglutamate synthase/dihydrofolate synthase [Lachnospiraceae bacterium ZAX-1]
MMFTVEEAERYRKETAQYGSVLGLDNMQHLMEELGQVLEELNVIHVAGTNGKGSVCAMIASILQQEQYKIGKYTSPKVFTEEEQYEINEEPITKERFAQITWEIKNACVRIVEKGFQHPTLFEIETAAAILWFYEEQCDFVLLETGLGGALDATNIIRNPICSVITSVSMDHMGFLGDTLSNIAQAKAGIIKEGCPVVTVLQKPAVMEVLKQACEEKHATLTIADCERATNIRMEEHSLFFDWEEFENVCLSLIGAYQVENSICAITTIQILNQYLIERVKMEDIGNEKIGVRHTKNEKLGMRNIGIKRKITPKAIKAGLAKAKWSGRFECICQQPLIIIDGAHNESAVEKLRETLEMGFTNWNIIYIIGVLRDKEYEKILKCMLPLAQKAYTVTPSHERALDGNTLCEIAGKFHEDVTFSKSVEEAVHGAIETACVDVEPSSSGTLILAFGSLSYLADVKIAVQKEDKGWLTKKK